MTVDEIVGLALAVFLVGTLGIGISLVYEHQARHDAFIEFCSKGPQRRALGRCEYDWHKAGGDP